MNDDIDGVLDDLATPEDGRHLSAQPMRELRQQVFDLIDDVNDELFAVAADDDYVPDVKTLLIGIGALAEIVVRRLELRDLDVGDG